MTDCVEVLQARLAQIDKNKEEIRDRIDRVLIGINMLSRGHPDRMYPILEKELTDLIQRNREQIAAAWRAHRDLVRLENRLKK